MKQIVLISAPWPLFNRPSIQMGALKAFIRQNLPGTKVDVHHFYLSIAAAIGYDLYSIISERTWLAESLYAGLLYPDRISVIDRFLDKRTSGIPSAKGPVFQQAFSTLKKTSARLIEREDWNSYDLAGFSICLSQLTSSLYFIREIKKKAPHLKIVAGGAACAGQMGKSLLQKFPEIDFVVSGEGELPLLNLIKSLKTEEEDSSIASIPGLILRKEGTPDKNISQVRDLDELPIPEYGDYFHLLKTLGTEKQFLPGIPMEISRGCWWRKHRGKKGESGCAFCNLNLQWHGYRAKSHERIIKELDSLTDQFQVLSISFMDNLLPAKNLEGLFKGVCGLGKDFNMFSEIRAGTSCEVLAAMGAAGMREVQVGIESLSSGLLKKLNKGTTAIDNLEIMKNCEQAMMPDITGNIILNFPSSDEQDAAETMENLEFVLPFKYLKGIPFWLGYGSPVWHNHRAYGLKRLQNHPYYKYLFPENILHGLMLMNQGYQGSVRYQAGLWKPVRKKLREWKKTYLALHKTPGSGPVLSYLDGNNFLIIRHRRYGKDTMTHRLQGTSRKIYLFCRTQRTISQIISRFPGLGEEKIIPFLRMLVDKRIMFNEGSRYLSLAIPVRLSGNSFL